jgi:hypothetical protein
MVGAGRGQCAWAAAMAVLAGAVVAVTVVAGCGTVRAGTPGAAAKAGGQVAAARTPSAGPVSGSAKEAQRLAGKLLSRLVLPAGAHRIPWHPAPVLRQTGIPVGVSQQAVARGLWLVPRSMSALDTFIRAHPPGGLLSRGFGHAGPRGQIPSEQATFVVRSLPAGIERAWLVLQITPAGRTVSTLRAGSEVLWYPPRSAAEYLAPARFHAVTVAARFLNPKPRVVRRTFASAAVIARLARFLDGLPAAPGGITSCSVISVTYTLAFKSSAAAWPYLVATASGCGGVGITVNGRTQPGLADPNSLIVRAAKAALAGHPGSLDLAPGPATPAPLPPASLPPPAGP